MSFGVTEVEKKVNSMPWMQSLNYTLLNEARDNHKSCSLVTTIKAFSKPAPPSRLLSFSLISVFYKVLMSKPNQMQAGLDIQRKSPLFPQRVSKGWRQEILRLSRYFVQLQRLKSNACFTLACAKSQTGYWCFSAPLPAPLWEWNTNLTASVCWNSTVY